MSNKYGGNLIVILVTYNRAEYTVRTFLSLIKTVPNAKFIFVDNASTDGTREAFEKAGYNKNHVVILKEKNEGWGSAVNEALAYIDFHNLKADYILVSNNDVEYFDDWYQKAWTLYDKYPQIGILGLWKHKNHGVIKDYGDLVTKDQMPGTCWLLRPEVITYLGPMKENGACPTKGGNGEDVYYCIKAEQNGLWVAGPKEDLAIHLDGYDN